LYASLIAQCFSLSFGTCHRIMNDCTRPLSICTNRSALLSFSSWLIWVIGSGINSFICNNSQTTPLHTGWLSNSERSEPSLSSAVWRNSTILICRDCSASSVDSSLLDDRSSRFILHGMRQQWNASKMVELNTSGERLLSKAFLASSTLPLFTFYIWFFVVIFGSWATMNSTNSGAESSPICPMDKLNNGSFSPSSSWYVLSLSIFSINLLRNETIMNEQNRSESIIMN